MQCRAPRAQRTQDLRLARQPAHGVRVRIAADASRLAIENLSIQDLAPQGGPQAEALRAEDCDQRVVGQVDIRACKTRYCGAGGWTPRAVAARSIKKITTPVSDTYSQIGKRKRLSLRCRVKARVWRSIPTTRPCRCV